MNPTAQISYNNVTCGNGNENCGNSVFKNTKIINEIQITLQQSTDNEKSEILKWIFQFEPPNRHKRVCTDRVGGVGNWIFETLEFVNWAANGSTFPNILFCYGEPGVGKTFISSLVIDTLISRHGNDNVGVFYLYCDYLTPEIKTATDLMGALLKGVLAGLPGLHEEIIQEFNKSKKHMGRTLGLEEIEKMLKAALASFRRNFICIDALDEFPVENRPALLRSLENIIQDSPGTRIFLTGRRHIRDEVERLFAGALQIISIEPTKQDISIYITERLAQDQITNKAIDDNLEKEIMSVIPQTLSGMYVKAITRQNQIFLLVALTINQVLSEPTISKRRKRLREMTKGLSLEGVYKGMLERVRDKLGLEVLMWLSHSERPLHADELCYALGIVIESTDHDRDNVPQIEALSKYCQGLVVVEKQTSTVRLMHLTLQKYLRDHPSLFERTHSLIAETCLTHLNFQCVRNFSPTLHSAPTETPFLKYASCYWGEHARKESTERVKTLALKLLNQHDKHISAKLLLLEKSWPWGHDLDGIPDGFSGLHCAAFFGLHEIAISLLHAEVTDFRRKDITGSTPLTWAARNGHKRLVRLFLKWGYFDPEAEDIGECTPFSWAARNGHKGVVELFLQESAINFETKDCFGRTPLSWASGGGHHGVVKVLLDRQGIDPETKDHSDRTPLSWASGGGHENVV
ncbi:hypothetical protein L873DRAFT_1711562, partial [Choiromyces venosus 120613-1]